MNNNPFSNVIFRDSAEEFRQRLENEEQLNALKNFSYQGLNIFSFYFDENRNFNYPADFADKIKILIDNEILQMKNGQRR